MKKWYLTLLLIAGTVLFTVACLRKKEKTAEKKYISILSLIRQQVAHVDTALYSIMKVVTTDSLHSDTSYIRREDFGAEAKDFLAIPDLSDKRVAKRYKEEPAVYDEALNRVIISYTAVNPAREAVIKQEILVTPNTIDGDKVNTVMITYSVNSRDGLLKKEMLWQMDRSFQVVTTTQLPGQPEKFTTTRVTWNEDFDQ